MAYTDTSPYAFYVDYCCCLCEPEPPSIASSSAFDGSLLTGDDWNFFEAVDLREMVDLVPTEDCLYALSSIEESRYAFVSYFSYLNGDDLSTYLTVLSVLND